MSAKKLSIGLALLALVLLLGMPIYANVYNRHVFPLGRLAGSVNVGDEYEEVRRKFAAYHHEYRDRRPVQFSEFETEEDLLQTRRIPKSRGLHVYDESFFDDVQVSVLFDQDGRVLEKLFIGD